MNCSACNGRIPEDAAKCPECGRAARGPSLARSNPPLGLELQLDQELAPEADAVQAAARKRRSSRRPGPSASGPRSAEVRRLVVDQPELVEAGLATYSQGGVTGAAFATPVGEIDLLANDSAGAFVVLMVVDADGAKELVSDLLPRLGWVRKHLAKKGQEVRAIVLLESLPEEARYAAAAVADKVCFKTYRLALTFDDVAL